MPLGNFKFIWVISQYEWNQWSDEHMWWLALEFVIHESRFKLWPKNLSQDKVLTSCIPLGSFGIWPNDWTKKTWLLIDVRSLN